MIEIETDIVTGTKEIMIETMIVTVIGIAIVIATGDVAVKETVTVIMTEVEIVIGSVETETVGGKEVEIGIDITIVIETMIEIVIEVGLIKGKGVDLEVKIETLKVMQTLLPLTSLDVNLGEKVIPQLQRQKRFPK